MQFNYAPFPSQLGGDYLPKWGIVGLVILIASLLAATGQIIAYRTDLDNSAQFVGAFPHNIPAITDLIGRTKYRMFILEDYCGYGFFSDPEDYESYKSTIIDLKKNKGLGIEIHVYDDQTRAASLSSELDFQDPKTAPQNYESLKNNRRFIQYFKYKKDHGDPRSIPPDYTSFLNFLQAEHSSCVTELRNNGIDVRTDVASPLPVFMWLRDDSEEAIFSIYNLGHASREISQRTENKDILLVLRDIATKSLQGR